jgi:hypothetical protein
LHDERKRGNLKSHLRVSEKNLRLFLCYAGELDGAKEALMKAFEGKEFVTTQQLGFTQDQLNKILQKEDDLANDLNEVNIPCTAQGCNLDNLIPCDNAFLFASGRIVDSANQSPACHLTVYALPIVQPFRDATRHTAIIPGPCAIECNQTYQLSYR